jgi:phosphoglycolate phosphatase-like HAD superfamily hydrolase
VIRLLLFDIDGTLVLTGGAGGRAMSRAFGDVFDVGAALGTLSLAGRTDAWIFAEIAARHAFNADAAEIERFHDRYIHYLEEEIQRPGPRKGMMPGVRQLLDALAPRRDVYLALLTGNFEAGARVKLEYFDLWRYFRCGAYGDRAPDRNALFQQALHRVAQCGGPHVQPADVVIVGDTPHDVAVAAAGGGRSVGVATGGYSAAALRESGADIVLEDLSDLDEALAAIGLEAAEKKTGAPAHEKI